MNYRYPFCSAVPKFGNLVDWLLITDKELLLSENDICASNRKQIPDVISLKAGQCEEVLLCLKRACKSLHTKANSNVRGLY